MNPRRGGTCSVGCAGGAPLPAATPVASANDAGAAKVSIDRICATWDPAYLLLLGGPELVPLHSLANPLWTGDPSTTRTSSFAAICRTRVTPRHRPMRVPSSGRPAWSVGYPTSSETAMPAKRSTALRPDGADPAPVSGPQGLDHPDPAQVQPFGQEREPETQDHRNRHDTLRRATSRTAPKPAEADTRKESVTAVSTRG